MTHCDSSRGTSAEQVVPGDAGDGDAASRGRGVRTAAWLVPLLIPAAALCSGTSAGGRVAVIAAITVLACGVLAGVALRVLTLRPAYLWIMLLAGLLVVGFVLPAMPAPSIAPPKPDPLAGVLGFLRGLSAQQLARFSDLLGVLAGLALLWAAAVLAPSPRIVTRVLALTGAAAALWVLAQSTYESGRLTGLGCNPNYLGMLLAPPFIAAVGLVRYTRNLRWTLPGGMCLAGLLDTQSRTAFVIIAVGVVGVLVLDRARHWQAFLAGCGAAAGTVVLLTGGIHDLTGLAGRLGTADRAAAQLSADNELHARLLVLAARLTADLPLTGVGYGLFPAHARMSPEIGQYVTAHNQYLTLSAEAGVPALAAFLVLLWLGVRQPRSGDAAVLRALVVAFTAGLLLADPICRPVVAVPFWIALGCLLGSARPAAPAAVIRRLLGRRRGPAQWVSRSRARREPAGRGRSPWRARGPFPGRAP